MKNNKKIAIVIISTLFFTYTIQSMANEPNTKSSTANFKAQLSERLRMHQQSPNESDDEDDMEADIKSQQQFADFKKHQNSNNKYVSKIFALETLITKVPRIPDKENNTAPNQNNDATDDWDDDNISSKDLNSSHKALTFKERADIIGQKLGPIFAAKSKTNTKQPTDNNVKKPVTAIPNPNTTPIATTHSNDNISSKDLNSSHKALTFKERAGIIGQKLGPIFAAKSKTNTKQPTDSNVKKHVAVIPSSNTTHIATTHSNDNISTKDSNSSQKPLTFKERADIIGQKLGPIFAAKSKTNTKQPTDSNVKKPVSVIPNSNTTPVATTHSNDNISSKDLNSSHKALTFKERADIIGQKLGPIFAAKSKTNTKQPTGNNVKKPVSVIPNSNTTPIATTHSNDNISSKDLNSSHKALTFKERADIIGQKLGPIFAAKSKTNTKQPTDNNVKKPVTAIPNPNTTPIATTHSNDNISSKDLNSSHKALTFKERADKIEQKLGPIFAAKSKTNTKQPTDNNVKKPVTAIPNPNTTPITTPTHQTLICSGQSNAATEDIYYDAEDVLDCSANQPSLLPPSTLNNSAVQPLNNNNQQFDNSEQNKTIESEIEDVLDCSANQPSLLPPSTLNNSAVQPLNNNNQQFDNSEQNKTIESEIKVKAYFKEQEKALLKAAQTNDIATTSAITAVTATTVSAITSSISKMCQNHRNIISSGSNINNNTSWSIQGKIFSTAINPNESTENNKYNLKSNGIFVTSNKYLTEKIIIGITGLYANSAINYDQSVLTATDCTTYSLSLNGRYYLQRNIFIQGITGFINYDGKNKYTTQSSSKISGESYYGDFMLGCDLHHTNSQLILSPIVGIRYNRIYNSSYELFDDITIGSMNHNTLVGSVGFSTKYTINNISKNISVKPEFQALIHTNLYTNSSNNIMLEHANSINYSDVDNAKPISIDTKPICQLGAAITLLLTNKIELGGSYNIYFAEKYIVKVSTISMKANF
ncbi:autotransporter domain-containing protein [Orientia tsutsugamushi]|uniref:autotransporter domain-containing protein n=1 Tax=Orientia tsutsugamushi TaxID=784 RepID=UPI00123901D5|nr:autotransporter domain-containing protein [Orientia tsutsugamushi]QES96034.1 autotransporter domain-containing protein [Orientia tsutsugamushi]